MGNKGTSQSTSSTTSAPDPQAYAAYQQLLQRAQGVASTPYQPYTGELVAPVNSQQNLGISGVNQYASVAQPTINAAINQAQTSSAPLTATGIQQYMSPYTQNVVNATQAQFNNQNQQQLQNVRGNAIAQGALGGNREAIAEAETTNQQQLAQAPVIANLYNQGYGQAVNTAMGEQGIGLQGAGAMGNLGVAGQTAGLQGANAQIGAGTLQQNTQQMLDQALLQQYQQAQAFPYQQTQWLAGLDTGVGSQMGGTSSGQTTQETSPWNSIVGGLTSGVGLLGATGAFGSAGWLAPAMMALKRGGAVHGVAYHPVPESIHTLVAQQKQLLDGHRVAQLYPKGHPELRLPKGLSRAKMPNGDVFHYHPAKITKELLIHASKTGQENKVLGLGPVTKHDAVRRVAAGEHPVAVVERNGLGHEVRAAAGTHATAPAQVRALNARKSPGHHVSIESPDHTIAKRSMGGGISGYDTGGGVALYPYGGAPSWIPTMNIAHGSGAPHASAPSIQNQNSDPQKQANQIGQMAKSLTEGLSGNGVAAVAPGEAVPGAFGATSAGGAAGPTPLVSMYARGGVAGYADGGSLDDTPASFEDRFDAATPYVPPHSSLDDRFNAAFPNYVPPPTSTDDNKGVINPDEPFRMPDEPSVDRWRKGVDQDLNLGQTAQDTGTRIANVPEDNSSKDMPVSQGVAPSKLAFSGDTSPADNSNLPDEVALGYSDTGHNYGVAPTANTPTSGINWGADSKLWPALMAAGFGMMSSRSTSPGVAIGEGGQAGLATYASEQQREAEAQKIAQDMELARRREALAEQQQRVTAANQPLIFGPDGQPHINQNYITAKQQLERDWQPKLSKIGVNDRGDDVMGVYDPNTKRATDLQGNPVSVDARGVVHSISPGAGPVTTSPFSVPQSSAPKMPSSPNNATTASATQTPVQVASTDPNFVPGPAANVLKQVGYQTVTQAPPHEADATAAPGTEASRNTKFLSELAASDPGYALALQKAADYQLDPGKYASLRKDKRQHFIDDVLMYDPNYNPQNVGLIYRAQTAFLPGTKTGDTIGSFNTAISHLDLLKELYHNLNNPDQRILAKIRNNWNIYWKGEAMPNTVQGIAQMVSGEVVKATVGAQNALGDREEANKTVNRDLSTMQADDVIDKWERLMGGKLETAKFQYEKSTGLKNFDDKFLLPRSQQVLRQINTEASGNTKATTPAGPPQGAVGTRKDTSGKPWYVDSNGKVLGPAQ